MNKYEKEKCKLRKNRIMKTVEEKISIMEAYKDGEIIQCANVEMDDWEYIGDPSWDWVHFDYRVKPKPKIRPYANAKEFAEAMREHGPMVINGSVVYIVTKAGSSTISIDNHNGISYNTLLLEFKWQDGTPCGVEEKIES